MDGLIRHKGCLSFWKSLYRDVAGDECLCPPQTHTLRPTPRTPSPWHAPRRAFGRASGRECRELRSVGLVLSSQTPHELHHPFHHGLTLCEDSCLCHGTRALSRPPVCRPAGLGPLASRASRNNYLFMSCLVGGIFVTSAGRQRQMSKVQPAGPRCAARGGHEALACTASALRVIGTQWEQVFLFLFPLKLTIFLWVISLGPQRLAVLGF